MRKVESQIVSLVKDFREREVTGRQQLTKRDRIDGENGKVSVRLWNTEIALVLKGQMVLNSGGYRTPTTKSRLNALLQGMGSNWRIYQQNFQWWLRSTRVPVKRRFLDGIAIEIQ